MDHSLQPTPLFESRIRSLRKIHQGKVRDIYDVDADHLLIVTTDRLSAFDVVLPDPIPCKGDVLTKISAFWFAKTRALVPNHLTDPQGRGHRAESATSGRSSRAARWWSRSCKALPIEAVVRGYLIGSGYKDYKRTARCAASPCRPD